MEFNKFKIISNYYPAGFDFIDTTAQREVLDFFLRSIEERYLNKNETQFKELLDRLLSVEKTIDSPHYFGLVSNYIDEAQRAEILEKNISKAKLAIQKNNTKQFNRSQNPDTDNLVSVGVKKDYENFLKKTTKLKTSRSNPSVNLSPMNTLFVNTYNLPDNMLKQIISLSIEINTEFKDFFFSESTNTKRSSIQIIENIYPNKSKKEPIMINNDYVSNFYNKILFGPTGTGKSTWCDNYIKSNGINDENIFRVTFFEDYSYYDFFGQYKPIVLRNSGGSFFLKTNRKHSNGDPVEVKVDEHIVTYQFVPGVFFNALLKALMLKQKNKDKLDENKIDDRVVLLIDEINRGNCSSIFGDIFQLLDRDENGNSNYSITLSEDMSRFIRDLIHDSSLYSTSEIGVEFKETLEFILHENKFSIPSNMVIIATMNTSDQSLFPMDSAFKRRWDMHYCYIDYKEDYLKNIKIEGTNYKWLEVLKDINNIIYEQTNSEDKQIGQWFIKPRDGVIRECDFKNKLVSYLFFDVFKHLPEVLDKLPYSKIMNMKVSDIIKLFNKSELFNG